MVRAGVFSGAILAQPALYDSMKHENRRAWRELAYFSSIGFSVALSVFIGLGVGVYLDRRFDTSPWCTLIFLVLGIAAAFRNIGLAIKKSRKL
jgi:ATP synthase protein I